MNRSQDRAYSKRKSRKKDSMRTEKVEFKEGMLLFHPAYGPFVVKGVLRKPELGGDGLCYWLEPDRRQCLGTRFFIAVNRIQEAGFHPPLSQEDADKILEYLQNSDEPNINSSQEIYSLVQENTPWAFARILAIFSSRSSGEHTREEREALQRAVQGLSEELAYVLRIPVKSAALRIQKSIGFSTHLNLKIREALGRVG